MAAKDIGDQAVQHGERVLTLRVVMVMARAVFGLLGRSPILTVLEVIRNVRDL